MPSTKEVVIMKYSYNEHQRRLAREQEAREERAREQEERNEKFSIIDAAETPEDLLAALKPEHIKDGMACEQWMLFDGNYHLGWGGELSRYHDAIIYQEYVNRSIRDEHNNSPDNTMLYRRLEKVAQAYAIFWGKVAEAK